MSVIAGRYSAWTTVRFRRWPRATSAGSLLKETFDSVRRVRLVLDDVEVELREHGAHVVVAGLRLDDDLFGSRPAAFAHTSDSSVSARKWPWPRQSRRVRG
jgi:hypothetical protein